MVIIVTAAAPAGGAGGRSVVNFGVDGSVVAAVLARLTKGLHRKEVSDEQTH